MIARKTKASILTAGPKAAIYTTPSTGTEAPPPTSTSGNKGGDASVREKVCARVRYFARQFGQLDVKSFVRNNCRFIENYYPEFKCSHVDEYVMHC